MGRKNPDIGWLEVMAKQGLIEGVPLAAALEEDAAEEEAGGKFVKPDFVRPMTWILPIETKNEGNERDWRGRSRRAKLAREIVMKHFAPRWMLWGPLGDRWRAGGLVRCKIVRLGGRKLDRAANLGSAIKATEDAVANLLGINDNSDLWDCQPMQEPGGLRGVRIELSAG